MYFRFFLYLSTKVKIFKGVILRPLAVALWALLGSPLLRDGDTGRYLLANRLAFGKLSLFII